MREYVLLQVLRFHRRLPEIEDAWRRRAWDQIITPTAQRRPVGVLGLGNLGADGARQLAQVGFAVHGWSRRPTAVDGIACHSGPDGIAPLLPQVEIGRASCRARVCQNV